MRAEGLRGRELQRGGGGGGRRGLRTIHGGRHISLVSKGIVVLRILLLYKDLRAAPCLQISFYFERKFVYDKKKLTQRKKVTQTPCMQIFFLLLDEHDYKLILTL